MATNEGVGKKIVEALKKQSENELELNQELVEVTDNNDIEPVSFENNTIEEETAIDSIYNSSEKVEPHFNETTDKEDSFTIKEQPVFEEPAKTQQQSFVFERPTMQQQGWNFDNGQEFQTTFVEKPAPKAEVSIKQFDMPPNVSVLKKLITQLPAGVTKQTGAQIIKQTMEALGISMNTVLHEAQKVQDDMNESIKSCMLSIQEYKNNIRNLEKQGLDYQRQVNQLNDLISWFILSDKD